MQNNKQNLIIYLSSLGIIRFCLVAKGINVSGVKTGGPGLSISTHS